MDTYDKATRLLIPNEDLEQAKFIKTLLERIAVRVGNEFETPLHIVNVGATKGVTSVINGVTDPVIGNVIELPVPPADQFIAKYVLENLATIDDVFHELNINIDTEIQVSTDDGANYDTIYAGYELVVEPRAVKSVKIKSNGPSAPYRLRVNFEVKEI